MSDFSLETHPTARKQHRCDCTGAWIVPGAKYWRCAVRFEGDFYDIKIHELVMPMLRRLNKNCAEDELIAPGDFLDFMYDRLSCDPRDKAMLADAVALENLNGLWWSPLAKLKKKDPARA